MKPDELPRLRPRQRQPFSALRAIETIQRPLIHDKERQGEMWHTVRQLLGELQQMWGDFQGDDLADLPDEEFTGDQA